MRMVYMSEDDRVKIFAKEAAKHFASNEEHYTYTGGDIEAGCLFALRWGLGDDCVVVFRLDEDFEPTNYQQLIRQYGGDQSNE